MSKKATDGIPMPPGAKRCPKGSRKIPGTVLCRPTNAVIKKTVIAATVVPKATVIKKTLRNNQPKGTATKARRTTQKTGRPKLFIEPDSIESAIAAISSNTLDETSRNMYLRYLEQKESDEISASGAPSYIYPPLTDPMFNLDLVEKKEFADLKSDTRIYDLESQASKLCESAEFELLPHQAFVRNFLSFRTPYNGLLLFHGLGTGKTCSAISVTEEMRQYLKQIGESKRIIIVASPNVQENFKKQLFDDRKLQKLGGRWNIRACAGEEMLREINPMGVEGLEKPDIVRLVKQIIRRSYLFMGPEQFSNYIARIMERYASVEDPVERKRLMSSGIDNEFSGRLIVIDEAHNIRTTKGAPTGLDKKGDKTAKYLHQLVKNASNLKLLLMSATPMFNAPEEIVWLINLLRLNDKRPPLLAGDVFTKDGVFIQDRGRDIGRDALVDGSRGYVSYIRGDNPYAFPFKFYPKMFAPDHSYGSRPLAQKQMNGATIIQPLQFLDLYMVDLSPYQMSVYTECVGSMAGRIPDDKGIGYQALNLPLQALDIVYPPIPDESPLDSVGRSGLNSAFTYDSETKRGFAYRQEVLEQYGRFLAMPALLEYSAKIAAVCEAVASSEGIVLVYSQYIDGGCVPIALALEEMGLTRSIGESLLAEPTKVKGKQFSYAMITGDPLLSPNNAAEIRKITDGANANGSLVKVVIISEAGSEGIDLTNIRQVHIMDPWYNLNRLEQIVGRAVRWCSHRALPFSERNVEIRYYGSTLIDKSIEAADTYVYRLAERKGVKIGAVSRALKENAIDCLLNKNVLDPDRMKKKTNQKLSSGLIIDHVVGDKPRTSLCDFMDECAYTCSPADALPETQSLSTYTDGFVTMNIGAVEKRVVDAFTKEYAYTRADLVSEINMQRDYSLVQIDAALTRVLSGIGPPVIDMLGRRGTLVNIGEYYLFQPIDLQDARISMYERRVPIPNKPIYIPVSAEQKVQDAPTEVKKLLSKIERQIGWTEREHDYQKLQLGDIGRGVVMSEDGRKRWAELQATVSEEEYETLGVYKEFYREIRTDLDWHKMLGNALVKPDRLNSVIALTREQVLVYTCERVLDVITLDEKIALFGHLVASHSTPFEKGMLLAYTRRQYDVDGDIYMTLAEPKDKKLFYYVVTDQGIIPTTPVQRLAIIEHIAAQPLVPMAPIIGMMVSAKSDGDVVFKVRDTSKPRAQGHRCDQKGRRDAVRTLNTILGDERYAESELPKNAKELCVDEELLLRHYDRIAHNGQRWFLGIEEAIRTNLGRNR